MTVRATGMQAVLHSFSRALTRLERGDRSVNIYDYEVNEDPYRENQQLLGK
jgi:TnpA family transposase